MVWHVVESFQCSVFGDHRVRRVTRVASGSECESCRWASCRADRIAFCSSEQGLRGSSLISPRRLSARADGERRCLPARVAIMAGAPAGSGDTFAYTSPAKRKPNAFDVISPESAQKAADPSLSSSRLGVATETLQDLLEWAPASMKLILGLGLKELSAIQHQRLQIFERNMATGIVTTTSYSGMDMPVHCSREIEKAYRGCRGDAADAIRGFVQHYSSCDLDRSCQKALLAMHDSKAWPCKFACQHLFADLLSSVKGNASKAAMASLDDELQRLQNEAEGETIEKNNITKLLSTCKVLETDCFTKESEAWCCIHEQDCLLFPTSEAELIFHIAGPTCVDFSRRKRKRLSTAGPNMKPLAVWAAQFKASNSSIGIHEGVLGTPKDMVTQLLQGNDGDDSPKWLIEHFELNPETFGVPARRERRYTVFIDQRKYIFTGNVEEFCSIFERPMRSTGSIFFEGARRTHLSALAPIFRKNLAGYKEKCEALIAAGKGMQFFCADLHQAPPFGSIQQSIPTLLTHGTIMDLENNLELTGQQHLTVQLLPLDSPVRFCGLSDAAMKHLAGNSMHCMSIGPLMLYLLATIVPRDSLEACGLTQSLQTTFTHIETDEPEDKPQPLTPA
jgi:hypothetical protein